MEENQKSGVIFFNAYRYLLIPQEHIQSDFYSGVTDKETLNKNKNTLFEKITRDLPKSSNSSLKFQIVSSDSEKALMKMGIKRNTTIGTADLLEKKMDDWHTLYLIFGFKRQMLLVQHKTKVSPDTASVVRKLLEILNPPIEELSLSLQMNVIPKENFFWDMVEKYEKRIREVDFILTAPNFAEISKYLGEEIKTAMQTTAAAQAKLEFVTDKNSALSLHKDDPNLASMVKYAQAGGGSFSLKLHGLKRKTSKEGARVLSIDSVHLEGNTNNLLDSQIIKGLFDDAEN